ncbi:aspartic peptidase domain-containing protein [Bisporella sp. PMI_857]|nr:aspartic peptidase domain-containing protein [Bisporella sp. PMI_857]
MWSPQVFLLLQCLSLPNLLYAAPNPTQRDQIGTVIPLAVVVPPSGNWEGNDGLWSTFSIQIGSPAQKVNALVSTASNQQLVVSAGACSTGSSTTCKTAPASTFDPKSSSTWIRNNGTAQVLATDLNSTEVLYGTDTIALSGISSLSSPNQLLGITPNNLSFNSLGLNPSSSNFSSSGFSLSYESYISSLKSQNKIPSLSYGYAAGAHYRQALGSLTLGGYDASLVSSNNLTVSFNNQTSVLSLTVHSISISSSSGKRSLSTDPFSASVHSTTPFLSLPLPVCQRFEDAFGITYDDESELYLLNDTLHSQLLSRAANITFTLTDPSSQALVNITLPYQAFDLLAEPPFVKIRSRHFPLKRAKSNSDVVLGRAFLQEAYLITDYERSAFSISQRRWANTTQDIRTIIPPSAPIVGNTTVPEIKAAEETLKHEHSHMAAIIAAVVGGVVLLTVVFGCFIIIHQRKRRLWLQQTRNLNEPITSSPPPPPKPFLQAPSTAVSMHNTTCELESVFTPSTIKPPPFVQSDITPPMPISPRLVHIPSRQQIIHELPAGESISELIGSPVYESPMIRRQREQWEFEQERQRIRILQEDRRNRLRDSP